jgi:hypothetical protein
VVPLRLHSPPSLRYSHPKALSLLILLIEDSQHPALRLVVEGLQMEGGLEHLGAGKDSDRMLLAYIAKFPTVKLLCNHSNLDLAHFSELFHSQLYAFSPTRVFYANNQDTFAARREITAIFTLPPLSEASAM